MKCSICELEEVATIGEAAEKDWSPCWYDRAPLNDQHDPICPKCVDAFMEFDADGEMVPVESIADTLIISPESCSCCA